MPRLGDSGNGGGGTPGGRPSVGGGVAAAYPNPRRSSLFSILSILLFILFLRNVFFKDYRNEEIGYLRAAGKSEEEIARYVPKTASERMANRKEKMTEYALLKMDVAKLKAEVHELRVTVLGEEAAKKPPGEQKINADKSTDGGKISPIAKSLEKQSDGEDEEKKEKKVL